jgi:hypothetical protein
MVRNVKQTWRKKTGFHIRSLEQIDEKQYILKKEKSSMVYQVLKATWENPIKNDFVKTCEEYMNTLDIKLSFDEIEEMSQWSLKKLVKAKTEAAGLRYLQGHIKKQTKASDIVICESKNILLVVTAIQICQN